MESAKWTTNEPERDAADITQLASAAAEAGDLAMVELCRAALRGDAAARRECEDVMRQADAQEC